MISINADAGHTERESLCENGRAVCTARARGVPTLVILTEI